jgi:hypothetical protein
MLKLILWAESLPVADKEYLVKEFPKLAALYRKVRVHYVPVAAS